ncbi:hypothetical protein BH09BAC6_BH09BAC6_01750 [soil metagenome]|jgi:hypothetical protein
MEELVIRWEAIPGTPGQVMYYVNDVVAGSGDTGFDAIINILKQNPEIERVALKDGIGGGVGGESLSRSWPFEHRYDELKKTLGNRTLLIDYL